MADDDEQVEASEEETKKSGGLMKTVISAVGIFVLVLAAQVVAPLITNAIYGPPGAQMAEGEEGEEGAEEEEEEFEELPTAIYQPLDPALVINFEQADGSTRFLQLTMQVMARDQAVIDAVQNHLPQIRNNFLFLISNREYDDLSSVDGKEQLRAELLAEVRAIIKKNFGEEGVEDVYFTSFVMQ